MEKQGRYVQLFTMIAIVFSLLMAPVCSVRTMAAGVDRLSAKEKNSSYGFFVWLSENAANAEDRKDAEAAAQILKNEVSDAYKNEVMNDGHIIGGSTKATYNDLINATQLGEENDATSLDCLRDAVHFVSLGNQYRAKENLAPLKISSAMMAMSELDANIQNYPGFWGHPSLFKALENLSFRRLGGTWKYGNIGGGSSDDPFEGWYTEEKKYYDAGNTKDSGHYRTMTDRQGKMLITGFGVRHRYVDDKIEASDGNYYDVKYHDKYYSQHYSTRDTMYNIGNGFTPEEYLAYLDQYQCYAVGHKLTETKGKDSTCTEPGTITYYTCSVCNKRFSDEEGKTEVNDITTLAKGHQWNEDYTTDKEATCTEEGEESIHCSVCGDVKEGSARVIAKKAHEYGEWKTITEATYDQTGLKRRTCKYCDAYEEQDIPVLVKPAPADPAEDGPTGDQPAPGNAEAAKPTENVPQKVTTDIAPNKPVAKEAVEKLIYSQKSDADPKGSSFGLLSAKGTAQSNQSIRVTWNRVKGASGYIIYGNVCGAYNSYKKILQTSGTSYTQGKLKKGTYYKYLVVAVNGNKALAVSKTIHVATKGGKVGNNKKVKTKAKKNKVTLKKGKTFKLKAKAVARSKKLKVKKHRAVKYETTNKKVASVASNGKIRAAGKGTCYVYAYAQDGVYARVKVTVK